ncbi:MAG: hypothetical protein JNK73_13220 [Bacteroidia bacterium]|nr:hypothetical protein [Bacteroidia bacterium]
MSHTAHSMNEHTAIGTVAGSALTIVANIGSQDVVKTIVLGIIGAIVGFITTQACKWIYKGIKRVFSK